MRISEKTIELNFCAQYSPGVQTFWFGLTQEQEKRAGFDMYTRQGGRLLILQFKASAHVLLSGERRFHAPHHQLTALQARLSGSRDIYYLLPSFGRTAELHALGHAVVANMWWLNVADIPAVNPPTRRDGALRKNGKHYFDLDGQSGDVTIWSNPVFVRATRGIDAMEKSVSGPRLEFDGYEDFSAFARRIGRKAIALVIPA
jgi:hypothetical protein